jgi:hypothetical protein
VAWKDLTDSLLRRRLKALRFGLINLAGQVRERSRQLQILLSPRQPAFELLQTARRRIAQLAQKGPPASTQLG